MGFLVGRGRYARETYPTFPPAAGGGGQGVPLTIVGVQFVAHVNAVTGTDTPQTDGSAGHPFKTVSYLYKRLGFLSQSSIPDLSEILTSAAPTLHVFLDTPLPQTDPPTILIDIFCPEGGLLFTDGSPSQSVAFNGALTAIAQTQNYALSPAHFQVLTLNGAAAGLSGKLFVDVTQPSSQWIYRDGAGAQVPGANNVNVARLLATTDPLSTNVVWPNVPPAITPGGTDACQVITLGSFSAATGGMGFTVRGHINNSTTSAQFIFYRCGFVDGGQFQCSGYGAQGSFVECSFGAITSIGQAVSMYNCAGNPFVVQRGLDHYVLGGWIRNKLGINQATNVTVDALIMDSCVMQIGTAGGGAPGLGEIGFYTSNVNTPGIDLSSGEVGCGGGVYSGQIGYLGSNLTYPFRSSPNTNMSFFFPAVFGALAGTPLTIGFYPWPLAIFATYNAIRDPYSGAFGGASQGTATYPVSQRSGQDTAGGALGGGLVLQPGSVSQFYVNSVGGTGWTIEVEASTAVTESTGAGAAVVSMQVWVDGAPTAGEPVIAGIGIDSGQTVNLTRVVRIQGLSSALHTFGLALAVTSGAAKTNADVTRVSTFVVPQA